MSAVVGLIDTAPSAQLEVLLNVSERGTLGAPVRVLPVPRTSGGAVAPEFIFHRDAWGAGTVTVRSPPVASVSITIPLTTPGTFNCEKAAPVPAAETNVPSGTV